MRTGSDVKLIVPESLVRVQTVLPIRHEKERKGSKILQKCIENISILFKRNFLSRLLEILLKK